MCFGEQSGPSTREEGREKPTPLWPTHISPISLGPWPFISRQLVYRQAANAVAFFVLSDRTDLPCLPPCRTDEGAAHCGAALPVILICPHDAQPLAQRRGYTVGYLVFARVLVNRSQYANFGVTMPCDDHVRKAATPQCFTSDSAAVKSRTCPPVPYFGDCASLISAKPNSQNS